MSRYAIAPDGVVIQLVTHDIVGKCYTCYLKDWCASRGANAEYKHKPIGNFYSLREHEYSCRDTTGTEWRNWRKVDG